MDCSLPGSSLRGILQARVLEWVAFPSPGDLPDPGVEPRSPAFQADALTSEPPGKPENSGCMDYFPFTSKPLLYVVGKMMFLFSPKYKYYIFGVE